MVLFANASFHKTCHRFNVKVRKVNTPFEQFFIHFIIE